jgi:hypothetical protein
LRVRQTFYTDQIGFIVYVPKMIVK